MIRRAFPVLVLLAGLLAACGGRDDSALDVGFIDTEESFFSEGLRLSTGAQHVRAATRAGLVALNAQGEVVPALADRWNVTDDGRIFVFRLRDGSWPDDTELTAESVRQALDRRLRELRGTSLGLDISPIEEVRPMAGRVVEIRLSSPVPALLQLLAQPELSLDRGEGETGPMVLERGEGDSATLEMKPPELRGLPEQEDWQENVRPVRLYPLAAEEAISRFDAGDLGVVLGGRIGSLPLVDTGPLSRGTVQLDPAIGLFGLHVRRARGVLESAEGRAAIAMAIDRPALLARFNIGGWVPTTRVVPPDLAEGPGLIAERWSGEGIDQRRERAAARIRAWTPEGEDEVPPEGLTLSVAIPEEPGLDLLYRELAAQLAEIGITLTRATDPADADLVLVDRVARYAGPRWFLNQFNCSLDRGLCSEDADFLVEQALEVGNPLMRGYLLAEAEAALTLANVYIPFGSPLRWSLVRGNVNGYAPNRWAFHPLPDMAVIPR